MSEKFILRNYMLEYLSYHVPIYIEQQRFRFGGWADSPEFAERFMLAALNLLPSKYVTSAAGEIFSRHQLKLPQHSADITAAFLKAGDIAMQSMENPTA